MKSSMKLTLFATVSALALAGCSGDRITDSSMSLGQVGLLASKTAGVPWKGDCAVDATFTGETTLLITGICHLTHLGRTSLVAYQTIVPGAAGIAYTNSATYTAANGDVLRTTNAGVATPSADGLTLVGTETAMGGTGRFRSATGTAALTGQVRFTGPSTTSGSYSLDGSLKY